MDFPRYLTRHDYLFLFIPHVAIFLLPIFNGERGKNPFSYLTIGFPSFFPVFQLTQYAEQLS